MLNTARQSDVMSAVYEMCDGGIHNPPNAPCILHSIDESFLVQHLHWRFHADTPLHDLGNPVVARAQVSYQL